jgi:hypothetical protein
MQTMLNAGERGVLWISRCRSQNDADPNAVRDAVTTNLKARNMIIKLRVYKNYTGKASQHLLVVMAYSLHMERSHCGIDRHCVVF